MEDEAPALVGQIEQELTIAAGQRAAFSVIPLICSDFISFSCARICFLHLSPGNQRAATAGERKERIQGAVGDGNRVTRVREWRGGRRAAGLMVQFVSEKKFIDGNGPVFLEITEAGQLRKISTTSRACSVGARQRAADSQSHDDP